ncbi:2,5-dichloro-2,5-cyclohexadiene-1,4-diol dehydrogenase [Ramaria rubella]|nr:2,5-dichloro-2,5-cyclohexadiene-1,4-diol dehydrogenase [Ramaria rubella]
MDTEKTNRLLGRVAIVTGAGSRESPSNPDIVGNGRAASILLARAGALVVLVDRNQAWAQQTQEMIESVPAVLGHGPNRTLVVTADVTKPLDCESIVKATMEKWGRLDILVNNVGVGGLDGTAVDLDVDEWRKGMDINVLSMVLMSKYVIPEMLRTRPSDISRGTGKAIVNMSSVAGLQGGIPSLLYPTSKGAIVNMTRAMAAHHGADGIRVNAVAPGTVFTPMVVGEGMPAVLRQARKNLAPLRIEGYGWDVGNAVVFLSSDEARWITGVTLPVDAGRTAGQPPRPGGPVASAPGTAMKSQSGAKL